MQEVRVPVLLDRRDGVDYVNEHVNLFVRNDTEALINGQAVPSGGFIIDFEPQPGSRASGHWLNEDAILARFYNNRATEFLAQDDSANAYAYFRAALKLAPDYAPAYTNLAHLYARQGLQGQVEQLLQHAIALGGPSYAALRAMAQLLLAQGRDTEAQQFTALLARRQDEDPYHWLGVGLEALQAGHNRDAISALEKAAALTTGFEEIHYHLGLAYVRDGQLAAARRQLALLADINRRDPGIAVLSKKLQGIAPQSAVF
jgi:tetratricopeptide (TPR) repeat protein